MEVGRSRSVVARPEWGAMEAGRSRSEWGAMEAGRS